MMKKVIAASLVLTLVLTGCSMTTTVSAPDDGEAAVAEETAGTEDTADTEQTEAEDAGNMVGMANPWRETDQEEAEYNVPRLFSVPLGAENVTWRIMENKEAGEDDAVPGALVELDFDLDGISYCARAQYGVEDTDISGMYYEWNEPETVKLASWGGGEAEAKVYRSTGEEGAVLCTWYDIEIGIAYSLSAVTDEAETLDIVSVVDSMGPVEEFMPSDFLQEREHKESFESEEEVISALQEGEGYTHLKLTGSDAEVLGITEAVAEEDGKITARDIAIYVNRDGKYSNAGNAFSAEDGDAIRYADGILILLGEDSYESHFLTSDGDGLMVKDYIYRDDSDGTETYGGFLREANDFDHDEDVPEDGKDIFDSLMKEGEKAPYLEFTVVE